MMLRVQDNPNCCVFFWRSKTVLWCIVILFTVIALPGCSSEKAPDGLGEPPCEARKTTDPGRLNIDTKAKNYGSLPPCEASLLFYIARNTELKSLGGNIKVIGEGDRTVRKIPISAEHEETDYGLLDKEIEVGPFEDYTCRELSLRIESPECQDREGKDIVCPDIRIKRSQVLNNLNIEGDDLDVCYDD